MNDHKTGGAQGEPAWVGDVLHFWFEELSVEDWFRKDDAVDARIRADFLSLHERLQAQPVLAAATPRLALASVIVLDQFPRNMFRGDRRAYATDSTALHLAKAAIADGFDAAVDPPQRLFLYLPLEHSEDVADQRRAVELVGALGNPDWTRYSLAHQAIIERFGRFPHRNGVLGRVSTADELAMLHDPMGSF